MGEVTAKLLAAIRNYQMPEAAIELLSQHPPLVIASMSAGGKTSTAIRIIEKSNYQHVVTHTTRTKRPDETNGVNYWFVNETRMLELVHRQSFIEVKPVHGDTVYGTSLASYGSVVQAGHKPLLIMDVQGIQEIVKNLPDTRAFFILPPDYETWMRRLEGRGQMSYAEKAKRLDSAKQEVQTALNDPHFVFVINKHLEDTAQAILGGPVRVNQMANHQLAQSLIDQIRP